jgi:putative aldouronate transport system substrate-binding protein
MMHRMRLVIAVVVLIVLPLATLSATGTQEDNASEGITFNQSGYPITSDTVTLRIATIKRGNHGDFMEMPVILDYEQKTNIHVEWDQIPQANARERLNLVLASADLPDAFMGMNLTASDIMRYGPQGILVPLEDIIDEYSPNIQALHNSRPAVKNAVTAVDGHIYSLAKINESIALDNSDNSFINRAWLDTLELDIPETTDEFAAVLSAFKSGDPNGNGLADEIPFSFRYPGGAGNYLGSMFGSFGVLANKNQLMVIENEVVFSPVQPGYKDAIVWFNDLYEDGLLDPEAFTQSMGQYKAKGRAEDALLGSFINFFDEAVAGKDRAENDYVALPPLRGPEGRQMWNRYEGSIAVGSFSITTTNEYPEITMRWVDGMYEKRASIEFCFGKYGLNVNDGQDGKLQFLDDPSGTFTRSEFRYMNTPAASGTWAITRDIYDNMEQSSDIARKFARYKIYEPYMPEQTFPFVYYSPEQEKQLATLRTDIYSYVEQMTARWIVGEGDIDGDWNDYTDRLQRMGLEDMIKIFQAAYAAQM